MATARYFECNNCHTRFPENIGKQIAKTLKHCPVCVELDLMPSDSAEKPSKHRAKIEYFTENLKRDFFMNVPTIFYANSRIYYDDKRYTFAIVVNPFGVYYPIECVIDPTKLDRENYHFELLHSMLEQYHQLFFRGEC